MKSTVAWLPGKLTNREAAQAHTYVPGRLFVGLSACVPAHSEPCSDRGGKDSKPYKHKRPYRALAALFFLGTFCSCAPPCRAGCGCSISCPCAASIRGELLIRGYAPGIARGAVRPVALHLFTL